MKKYTLISIFLFSILFSFMIGILVGGFEYPVRSKIYLDLKKWVIYINVSYTFIHLV